LIVEHLKHFFHIDGSLLLNTKPIFLCQVGVAFELEACEENPEARSVVWTNESFIN
jgi:hypothetical protein